MKKIKSILNFILPNEFKIKLRILKRILTNNNIAENNSIAGILLNPNPSCYENGLISNYSCNFMEDDLFLESYNMGKKTGALRNHPGEIYWRAYVACWAANKAKTLPGDFVECGVNLGFLSRIVMHYTSFKNLHKKFYLLDTFSGFPLDTMEKEQRKYLNPEVLSEYKECYEEVKTTFSEFSNVIIVRGKVPDTLSLVEANKVAYLSLDMNNADAEIAAAEYFWDRMVGGSVILLDDYGHPSCIYHRKKFDEFCKKRNVQVLSLPNGQGLIFRNQEF